MDSHINFLNNSRRNVLQTRYMYTVFLNLCQIQRLTITFRMCSLLNCGFVSVVDTCVFYIVFVLICKIILLYGYINNSLESNAETKSVKSYRVGTIMAIW